MSACFEAGRVSTGDGDERSAESFPACEACILGTRNGTWCHLVPTRTSRLAGSPEASREAELSGDSGTVAFGIEAQRNGCCTK